jgi:hypothetical protein
MTTISFPVIHFHCYPGSSLNTVCMYILSPFLFPRQSCGSYMFRGIIWPSHHLERNARKLNKDLGRLGHPSLTTCLERHPRPGCRSHTPRPSKHHGTGIKTRPYPSCLQLPKCLNPVQDRLSGPRAAGIPIRTQCQTRDSDEFCLSRATMPTTWFQR